MNHVGHRHVVLIIILKYHHSPASGARCPKWLARPGRWLSHPRQASFEAFMIGVYATIIVKTMSNPTIIKYNVFVPCIPSGLSWIICVLLTTHRIISVAATSIWWRVVLIVFIVFWLNSSYWLNSSERYPQQLRNKEFVMICSLPVSCQKQSLPLITEALEASVREKLSPVWQTTRISSFQKPDSSSSRAKPASCTSNPTTSLRPVSLHHREGSIMPLNLSFPPTSGVTVDNTVVSTSIAN